MATAIAIAEVAVAESSAYKILISDRSYVEWNLYDALSLNEVQKINIHPSTNKLFSGDTFECNTSDSKNERSIDQPTDLGSIRQIKLLHSSVRSMPSIPGILVLKDEVERNVRSNRFNGCIYGANVSYQYCYTG